ncbi:MAG: hybrid sensor histidine kinase/response regulator [Ahrensia sp.]|nr:hybrid sensor histidine kinase/response regulator [Ahrensia sp.]
MLTERIPRIRRTYNKWVANQTLEDFALRFTAYDVRRFSSSRIANTAIGAVSFLALEAIGGAITLNYGFTNAAVAILVTATLIFLAGLPISYNAAKFGVDIDLLTRGAGFGYIGSTITSLVYASFTFIFFAIEAAIVATALQLVFGIPLPVGYVISALMVIPLVTHGVTFISRFQAWTQPFWVVLQIMPFVFIAAQSLQPVRDWTGYTGLFGESDGSLSIAHFGAASAGLFSLIAQIGEQVDYLRFLPRRRKGQHVKWWIAMISAGPGWIVIGALKIFAGSFLAFYAFRQGVDFKESSDPVHMYLTVFGQMVASPELALGLTGIFVVICQFKINVTNSYAGSIAWSNFFSRLTHSHPGRVVWLVFNVLISLLLMEFGIYKAFDHILGLYSIMAVAWVAAIVADLVINKPLGLSPRHIEFKRAHLYDINPVGFGAMTLAIAAALFAYFGAFGQTLETLYSYVALVVAFTLVPVIAIVTRGRYYIAREPARDWSGKSQIECCICEYEFDPEDMARCPVYSGPICSLCCSLDARCGDMCKTDASLGDQLRVFSERYLPKRVADWVGTSLARYVALMILVVGVIGMVFGLIYVQSTIDGSIPKTAIALTLTKLFVIVLVITGIVVWLFVLTQDSRNFAEEEARRHTQLLMTEIDAHNETDRQLQLAKEAAESANIAKSKYMVGLSHELRTPLNAILGYAQLLERQKDEPPHIQNAARTIKRSGEHLAGMIEGLLDISKIEAGKLEIYRQKTALKPFLDQIVDMFTLQAKAKGIRFEFEASSALPDYVYTDEKRLRQILINLLSNAIKFTRHGRVSFSVGYRNQVATFVIEDSGIGIAPEDLDRVFLPFERADAPGGSEQEPGTGLGLTITHLLVDIMGGDIAVESEPGKGTRFTIRLMLSSAREGEDHKIAPRTISGYRGPRRTVLVTDDNVAHRRLVEDFLRPLGFRVIPAENGHACLSALALHQPDIVLLDITMPDLSGWEVARRIRSRHGPGLPILMVSADAGAERNRPEYRELHDGYLIKPFVLEAMLDQIGSLLSIQWIHSTAGEEPGEKSLSFSAAELPSERHLKQLYTLGEAELVRSANAVLTEIETARPDTARFCAHLRLLANSYQMPEFLAAIEKVRHDAA